MTNLIYLDYAATTPLDERVFRTMEPWFRSEYANPHSDHIPGWAAQKAIDEATDNLASLLKAENDEFIFTAGATESNNLAIKGVMLSKNRRGNHLIVSEFEHKCVLETAKYLERNGYSITYLKPNKKGYIEAEQVQDAITSETALVSIMFAHNEIGTIQPVADISKICRLNGVLFHTDAAQAVGKVQIELCESNIDLLSISGHKMYGPKGIGALFVSNNVDFPLVPLFHGGGQQGGHRSGTLSPALCVGLGEAAKLASSSISEENFRISNFKNRLLSGLKEKIDTLWVNGGPETLPNIISVGFSDIDASNLLGLMQTKLAASTGSACNSGLIEPSYALVSIGLNHLEASSVVRFSIGRMTTEDEIDAAISIISKTYKRAISLAA